MLLIFLVGKPKNCLTFAVLVREVVGLRPGSFSFAPWGFVVLLVAKIQQKINNTRKNQLF